MKKQGFTLAEMVISITIVGAIAAVSIPLISNIIPDRKKVQVLKVHKTLTSINQEILADKGLYMPNNCVGLNCIDPPLNTSWTTNQNIADLATGESKYIAILADRMKVTDLSGIKENDPSASFTTSDGINWIFSKDNDDNIKVTVDIDPNNNGGCTHDKKKCTNPDRFEFKIAPATGKVFGGDSLTITYLKNPHNLSDRNNDFRHSIEYADKLQKELDEKLEEEKNKAS